MAGINPTAGAGLNSVPAPGKQTVASAFVDLRDSGWAQQYLPELMDKEAEVFGNRTISGFLAQVGAEEAMASDQVLWSEQGRLHIKEAGCTITTLATNICTQAGHSFRLGDTVVANATAGTGVGVTIKGYISAITTDTFTLLPYTFDDLTAAGYDATTVFTAFVYGSEYKKGQLGRTEALEPGFKSFENKPVIIKDLYEVSGSDASAIGWIEVSGEEGQNGYLWYLKASGDTMARFSDYCEMVCIEGELATGDDIQAELGAIAGTEGLFAAVKNRGHFTAGINSTQSDSENLESFDFILKKFDAQGAIEENMMFVNRDVSLVIDDMLAAQNSYGADGTSYGVFNNDSDMALNLGFSGFRRGSYDFYKSDWKYLNDANTRGAFEGEDIRGVFVPAGVSSVYDQMLGKNMKRPFLHVRYRASQTESRKMKTWITGSVGAATSDIDAMEVNYLSERCLITQGANNFMLLTD